MKQVSKQQSRTVRALVYGLLPCLLGLGAALYLRWSGAVWLAVGGGFWPIVLTGTSIALLIRLVFSSFEDRTSATAAWLILLATWFYVPMWATSIQIPHSSAVIDGDGHVRLASEATRTPGYQAWLLTNNPHIRVVHNVAGRVTASALVIDYRFAERYVATRPDGDDLLEALSRAANTFLKSEAERPRSARIALLDESKVSDAVLEKICRAAVGEAVPCPVKMRLSPLADATALGATWSKLYSEKEAVQERHVPTLVRLLTQSDAALIDRDRVFATLLECADSIAPIAQVARRPHWLSDEQFRELLARIMASPESGNDAAAIVANVNRLEPDQRRALRAKALDQASIAALLEQSVLLRLSDQELEQLGARMRVAFASDPGVGVRALELFGERLPAEAQRDAIMAIVKAKASFALAALGHVNFSAELREMLMKKVLADADHDDFAKARLSKEKMQTMFAPAELRALIEVAVKRSETSESWMNFALRSLAIHEMTPAERSSLLTGLLFKSPRSALEFVSENRHFLEPAEVNEVTRDYTRTIAADLCLHLSHRNANRRMEYFSEAQLQIFIECAKGK